MDSEDEYLDELATSLLCVGSALVVNATSRDGDEGVGRGNGIVRNPRMNWDVERQVVLRRFFMDNDRMCRENLRMSIDYFHRLCKRLKTLGLADQRQVTAEEQLALFLFTVGHDERNRNSVMQFFRSGQTVSRYFHVVLGVVMRLVKQVIHNATVVNSPTADCSVEKDWHHYFEGAVGAVDGTHFETKVPLKDQPRYRNRKGTVTQNVLVACTFDLRFTYVLAGWEGSAHDGRLLRDAVSRNGHKLTIPDGKYYLADAGFALVPGFLTPYRSTRYHLRDMTNPPQNDKEMFNFRHSSLRTVVERAIGILKMRWAYLRKMPYHDATTHSKIIIACCGLHNWLREQGPDGDEEDEVLIEPDPGNGANDDATQAAPLEMTQSPGWTAFRDELAQQMWEER